MFQIFFNGCLLTNYTDFVIANENWLFPNAFARGNNYIGKFFKKYSRAGFKQNIAPFPLFNFRQKNLFL